MASRRSQANRSTKELDPEVAARIRAAKGKRLTQAQVTDMARDMGPQKLAEQIANGDIPPDELPPAMQKQVEKQLANSNDDTAGETTLAKPSKRPKKYMDLERELTRYLSELPAAAAEAAEDEYCTAHFQTNGAWTASEVTKYCETHPAAYKAISGMIEVGGVATLSLSILLLAARPAVHHGAPCPDFLRGLMGVPPPHPQSSNDYIDGEAVAA